MKSRALKFIKQRDVCSVNTSRVCFALSMGHTIKAIESYSVDFYQGKVDVLRKSILFYQKYLDEVVTILHKEILLQFLVVFTLFIFPR